MFFSSMGEIDLRHNVWKNCKLAENATHTRSNIKPCKPVSVIETPPQSYGASPAIWDHTVLPATRHT